MKRSKILIPTLSALAVTPAIALVGCNKNNTEQNILDAVFAPLDLTKTIEISDFKAEFDKLSPDDKRKELLFGTFGKLNEDIGDQGTNYINIRKLYKDNEGAFKINIQKCDVVKTDNEYYGTLLGYISYIFEKEHKVQYLDEEIVFKANDYIMLTFDVVDAKLVVSNDDFHISWQPKHFSFADLGVQKWRFNGGKDETIEVINSFDTSLLAVKNTHNWVPKK